MVFTINNLCDACYDDDIQTVRDIFTSKEVDINDIDDDGDTPLTVAVKYNEEEIVKFLLTQPELQLDTRDCNGVAALHLACFGYNSNITLLKLLCKERRCTPSVVNIKDVDGWTALQYAVYWGNLENVKELEKIKGIDFDTKNYFLSSNQKYL